MRSFGEVRQSQWSNRYASEKQHFVSHASQDATDLAVFPLGQRHLQLGSSFANGANSRPLDPRDAFGEIDSLSQAKKLSWIQLALHDDKVGLWDTVLRMGQLLSQFPVVGQEQQSLAGAIQSADREKSTAIRHQVNRANSPFWIAVGAEHSCRFVEHQVGGALLP